MYDMILKGGRVIDPANDIDAIRDIAIKGKQIAAVEREIPEENAGKSVPVDGLIVTPGLVDIHIHAYGGYEAK